MANQNWTTFDDFADAEKLTFSDVLRMASEKPRLLPVVRPVNGTVWVLNSSIEDWRQLIAVTGFELSRDAAVEGAR